MDLLREKGLGDVLVVLGGIIPDADLPGLKAMGVAAVFRPGSSMQDIIDFIKGRLGAGRPTLSAADTKASSPSGR
jgi:methylmalonyl-CoA mutase C-terminal domain/subunit